MYFILLHLYTFTPLHLYTFAKVKYLSFDISNLILHLDVKLKTLRTGIEPATSRYLQL